MHVRFYIDDEDITSFQTDLSVVPRMNEIVWLEMDSYRVKRVDWSIDGSTRPYVDVHMKTRKK